MLKWLITFCIVALLGGVQDAKAERVAFYKVQPGDSLLERFGAKSVSLVVKRNNLDNPNLIFPGQILWLPDSVRPRADTVVRSNGTTKKTVRKEVSPVIQPTEFRWEVIGRAPLLNCGKKTIDQINEEAWEKLGLSEEDKAYLRLNIDHRGPRKSISAADGLVLVAPGTRIEQVTFCRDGKAVVKGPMRSAWSADKPAPGEQFTLPSGRSLLWMWECQNWVTWSTPEPVLLSRPALPAQEEVPPLEFSPPVSFPVFDIPGMPTPQERPPEEEKAPICLLDPKMVVGQEHEPVHNGDDSHSSYLTAALYCTWRGESGTHGVGFGLQGSWWQGRVNKGDGKFQGRLLAAGPGYEYISDNGWNLEGKLLFGRIHEYFNQGGYRSERTIDIVGPAASVNLGQRRARGEKFLPETRLFGMWGLPTSVEAKHSWQNNQIANTQELSRFGSYLNLGVHQDVYDFESFTLWGRVGYFRESPVSETMNLRVGVSDPNRICGIGVGLDFDLKNGGEAAGWGWWCDVVKGTQVVRSEYRLAQMVKETGATYEDDGTLFVPMPSVKPTD